MFFREICMNQTVLELKKIAKDLEIPGISKLRKSELVSLITAKLLDYDYLTNIFCNANPDDILAFEKVCDDKVKLTSENAHQFEYFLKNHLYVIINEDELDIPDDIKRLFRVIQMNELNGTKAHTNNILQYCNGAVNLYGVIPVKELLEIYNKYNESKITFEELEQVIMQNINPLYKITAGVLIHPELEMNNLWKQLMVAQEEKSLYLAKKDELLSYQNNEARKNDREYLQLKMHIAKNMSIEDAHAEELSDKVLFLCQLGVTLPELLEMVVDLGITLKSHDLAQEVAEDMINLYNKTRMWSYCGHTLEEANRMNPELSTNTTTKVSQQKIGRNDPCPCGSGNKYKRCCGVR